MKWRCHCGQVIDSPDIKEEGVRNRELGNLAQTHEKIHAIAAAIEAGKLPFYDIKLLLTAWVKHFDSVREQNAK